MKNIFIILLSCSILHLFAEKHVGGVIDRDLRWNAEDGPYILETDLVIPKYRRLIIGPGTKIVISSQPLPDTTLQIDDFDKSSISIKVRGLLSCVGRRSSRIVFSPELKPSGAKYGWYGIVFDNPEENGNEIICTDITGAYIAVRSTSCSPVIRCCIIENNHIGLFFQKPGNASVTNCFIGYNLLAGIRVNDANPEIISCIIIDNKNNGIWCDGKSKITLNHNCFWHNADGNFLECDPDFGLLSKKSNRDDSIDIYSNIFASPVFAGSPDDSIAAERDLNNPTDSSKVKSTVIADIIQSFQKKNRYSPGTDVPVERFSLSRYSPCIDAGCPDGKFKDNDGSRNDMGIYGGPEFFKE
jgi:hypothetical protein